MEEIIETTSLEIYPRQPVQIRASYSRKLKILAEQEHRSMSAQVEYWIEKAWNDIHSQPDVRQEERN